MSTPAEPQSVQQPDHEQPISDEVIALVDQPDFASNMEMIDLATKDDEEPSQKASPGILDLQSKFKFSHLFLFAAAILQVEPRPKKAKIDLDIRKFIIRQHSEEQTTNALPGDSNQASTVDELLASGATRKRDHAKEVEARKFNPDWVGEFPWLRMTADGRLLEGTN